LDRFPNRTIPPLFHVAPILSAYRLVVAADHDAVKRYQRVQDQPKAVKDTASLNVLASRVVGFFFPAISLGM
jgi:hypothetical protein